MASVVLVVILLVVLAIKFPPSSTQILSPLIHETTLATAPTVWAIDVLVLGTSRLINIVLFSELLFCEVYCF